MIIALYETKEDYIKGEEIYSEVISEDLGLFINGQIGLGYSLKNLFVEEVMEDK
jgi:hypothetical protein